MPTTTDTSPTRCSSPTHALPPTGSPSPSQFPDAEIAYFSPEFGVSKTLPQYSGGLGILAGDHLKAASDLDLPLVGVGLFYRDGFFHQSISGEASARALRAGRPSGPRTRTDAGHRGHHDGTTAS